MEEPTERKRRALERPLVYAIESSCDDTACALVDGAGRVLASVVSSQLEAHRPFGGVVPEIASREHLANWPEVSSRTLAEVGVELGEVDAVAATRGPGLLGSLLVGLSLGKAIAYGLGRPFFGVHHLEGHLLSPFLGEAGGAAAAIPSAFVGLVVSGGHTSLFGVEEGSTRTLAETRDDAMGEAFDKVAKRLGLPFPGGPELDRLAEAAPAGAVAEDLFEFRLPRCGDTLDFSFSGMKSQALRFIEGLEADGVDVDLAVARPAAEPLALIRAFRAAAVRQIVDRVDRCYRARGDAPLLAVSGGVAANRELRRELEDWAAERRVELELVPIRYSGDNAAMIAFAALQRLRRGDADDPRRVDAVSRLPDL